MLNHRKISRTLTAPVEVLQEEQAIDSSEKRESRNSNRPRKQRVKTVGSKAQNNAPILLNRMSNSSGLRGVSGPKLIQCVQKMMNLKGRNLVFCF